MFDAMCRFNPRACTFWTVKRTSRGLIAEIGILPICGSSFCPASDFFLVVVAARSEAVFASQSRATNSKVMVASMSCASRSSLFANAGSTPSAIADIGTLEARFCKRLRDTLLAPSSCACRGSDSPCASISQSGVLAGKCHHHQCTCRPWALTFLTRISVNAISHPDGIHSCGVGPIPSKMTV